MSIRNKIYCSTGNCRTFKLSLIRFKAPTHALLELRTVTTLSGIVHQPGDADNIKISCRYDRSHIIRHTELLYRRRTAATCGHVYWHEIAYYMIYIVYCIYDRWNLREKYIIHIILMLFIKIVQIAILFTPRLRGEVNTYFMYILHRIGATFYRFYTCHRNRFGTNSYAPRCSYATLVL